MIIYHQESMGKGQKEESRKGKGLLLSPLVLAPNLVLLLRREVVLDVECLADLLR
jgi:hypothetical protein